MAERGGIYRPRTAPDEKPLGLLKPTFPEHKSQPSTDGSPLLLHPKYGLPSQCFAYVGDANRPSTWKLPNVLEDGSIEVIGLPKAIQAILSNYRGARISSVPEDAIPGALRRLAAAAEQVGKMPH